MQHFQQQHADDLINLSVMDLVSGPENQIAIDIMGRGREYMRILKKIKYVYVQRVSMPTEGDG